MAFFGKQRAPRPAMPPADPARQDDDDAIDVQDDDDVHDAATDQSPDDTAGSQLSGVTDDKGVPVTNRLAELKRLRSRLATKQQRIEALEQRVAQLESGPGSQPVPAAPRPQPRADLPGATGLTEAQKRAAYNSEYGYDIMRATVREETSAAEERSARRTRYEMLQNAAASAAVKRYSALTDKSSEFYEAVDSALVAKLQEYQALGINPPPDTVLIVANEVAMSGQFETGESQDPSDRAAWDTVSRVRNADRGTPPPVKGSASDKAGVSQSLPGILARANSRTRGLGKTPEERKKALDEFIEKDPISQQALRMLEEGY